MMDEKERETAVCPECGSVIQSPVHIHCYSLLLCPRCETMLVVTAVHPLRLDWAFEEPADARPPFHPHFPFSPGS